MIKNEPINKPKQAMNLFSLIGVGLVLGGLLFFLLSLTVVNVPPGSVGVLFDRLSGGVSQTALGEGWHLQIPLAQSIIPIEVRTLKNDYQTSAASKDLQVVNSHVAVSFHIDRSHAPEVFKQLGTDFSDKIIGPAVQEKFKAATARFNAEDLIQNREVVRVEISDDLRMILSKYNIVLDEVSIVNFDFSASFNEAIEAKVVSTQLKQKAENDLQLKIVEAQQKVVEAQGEANSTILRAQANAMALKLQREQSTPELASIIIAQKWDGKLPNVMLGNNAMPLLDFRNSS